MAQPVTNSPGGTGRQNSNPPTEETNGVLVLKRPTPTPEQARLGIMPAAIGNGTFDDIMNPARARPGLDDSEFGAFEGTIADNRAMRRELAQEI